MSVQTLTKSQLKKALVLRRPDDHKGIFGHVLVIAGSRGMPGAPILSTRAALRSGAGLVTLATPSTVAAGIAAANPEAMMLSLGENLYGSLTLQAADKIQEYIKNRRVSCLAIGPGLSLHPDTVDFVVKVLTDIDIPAVIDADALNALSLQEPQNLQRLFRSRNSPSVLTPHPMEISRLLKTEKPVNEAARLSSVTILAKLLKVTVLLKGNQTLISDGTQTVVNKSGGPGLAKGGSGDVLTGLLAGLWAQSIASSRHSGNMSVLITALAAYLHGHSADIAERELSAWVMSPSDVINNFSKAFKSL